jgi:16S rRNA (cytidine1402-2'-O)-methyltransferase
MAGKLYVVSTPIGNLEDLTLRALRILKEVPIIAAEDPKRTAELCAHHAIETPLTSYHNDNKEGKTPVLIARLQAGQDIALVSDAGTPLLCDPGLFLVSRALATGISVVPVPGASAALAALTASGFPADSFLVLETLPASRSARRSLLHNLRQDPRTLILFESPGTVKFTLHLLSELLGNRRLMMAMDMTTERERFVRGTAAKVARTLLSAPACHEVTLVVEGARKTGRTRRRPKR